MVPKYDDQKELLNEVRDEYYHSQTWQMYLRWNACERIISNIWVVGGILIVAVTSLFVAHDFVEVTRHMDMVCLFCGGGMIFMGCARLFRQSKIQKRRYREAEEEIADKMAKRNTQIAV